MSASPLDTIAFAERLLALLDEGSFTSTYKFAVLLALTDLCIQGTTKDGEPPQIVTTTQLARKIVESYWRQVSSYDTSGLVLVQNAGRSAIVPRKIAEFRSRYGEGLTLCEAERQHRMPFAALVREVEWVLVKMPLPKLQRFGGACDSFVYSIHWDDDVLRGTFNDGRAFDNRIFFADDAAANLVRLSSLLRPLIQERWASKVADLNSLEVDRLGKFLFGVDRTSLTRLVEPLRELQAGRCFYCENPLSRALHVDHFIPWSRHPDDGIDNLVLAHERCNLEKRNFLAGREHLRRWRRRESEADLGLAEIAEQKAWPRDAERTLGSVRAAYLAVSREQRLWLGGSEFELAERAELRSALGY